MRGIVDFHIRSIVLSDGHHLASCRLQFDISVVIFILSNMTNMAVAAASHVQCLFWTILLVLQVLVQIPNSFNFDNYNAIYILST